MAALVVVMMQPQTTQQMAKTGNSRHLARSLLSLVMATSTPQLLATR